MQGNADGPLGHCQFRRGLIDRAAIDRDDLDDIALARRQAVEMPVNIGNDHAGFKILIRQYLYKIVYRQVDAAAPPTQGIHEFMPRDRPEPGTERRLRLEALALEMDR